ncbi:hypothetical protein RAZWK3B_07324 [Roseobacter sp. AzwK-3b]|nr:hypothetical protein RAZWK3B_07324 [Roseobacter sp. AzwK-3b]
MRGWSSHMVEAELIGGVL